MNVSNGT